MDVPASYLDQVLKSPDAVQAAVELGRLDLASALIALVGLIVAIFGLIGFFEIRSRAKAVAREEARRETKKIVPNHLADSVTKVLRENPDILAGVLRENSYLIVAAANRMDEFRELLFGDVDAAEGRRRQ